MRANRPASKPASAGSISTLSSANAPPSSRGNPRTSKFVAVLLEEVVERLSQQARLGATGRTGQLRQTIEAGPAVVVALERHLLFDVHRDAPATLALRPRQCGAG